MYIDQSRMHQGMKKRKKDEQENTTRLFHTWSVVLGRRDYTSQSIQPFRARDTANCAYDAHLLGAICCVRSGCEQAAQDPASTSALKALTTRHVYHQGHPFSQRCKPQNADYVLPSPSPAAWSVSCMDDKQCIDSTDRQFLALATAMAVRFY